VQSHVSLLTFEHIVAYADLADEAMFQLAKNLWSLSQKHSYADSKQVVSCFLFYWNYAGNFHMFVVQSSDITNTETIFVLC